MYLFNFISFKFTWSCEMRSSALLCSNQSKSLPKFRDNLSVPSTSVKSPRIVGFLEFPVLTAQ